MADSPVFRCPIMLFAFLHSSPSSRHETLLMWGTTSYKQIVTVYRFWEFFPTHLPDCLFTRSFVQLLWWKAHVISFSLLWKEPSLDSFGSKVSEFVLVPRAETRETLLNLEQVYDWQADTWLLCSTFFLITQMNINQTWPAPLPLHSRCDFIDV